MGMSFIGIVAASPAIVALFAAAPGLIARVVQFLLVK
jgi:hypothetical protein